MMKEEVRNALVCAWRGIPDPAKLRKLADWFDVDDANKGGDAVRGHDVQDDLRLWAHNAEIALRVIDAALSRADAAERKAAAHKGVATKMRNRAAAGTCPCCKRTFRELAEHMAAKHPDFRKTSIDKMAS